MKTSISQLLKLYPYDRYLNDTVFKVLGENIRSIDYEMTDADVESVMAELQHKYDSVTPIGGETLFGEQTPNDYFNQCTELNDAAISAITFFKTLGINEEFVNDYFRASRSES